MKGTPNFGLWYPKRKNLTVKNYTDADWVGSIDDKKSTRGNKFFVRDCLVS